MVPGSPLPLQTTHFNPDKKGESEVGYFTSGVGIRGCTHLQQMEEVEGRSAAGSGSSSWSPEKDSKSGFCSVAQF